MRLKLATNDPVIILAAGASSRLGQPKGLFLCEGRPWLEIQLGKFAEYGDHAVLVLGHHHEEYFRKLPYLASAQKGWTPYPGNPDLRIFVTLNTDPERGAFSSLQCGAAAVSSLMPSAHAFVLPVDTPVADRRVWDELAVEGRRIARRGKGVHPPGTTCTPTFQNKGGHPVWLSYEFLKTLLILNPSSPNARLDSQIQLLDERFRERIQSVDGRVTVNLNTPEDFIQFMDPKNPVK